RCISARRSLGRLRRPCVSWEAPRRPRWRSALMRRTKGVQGRKKATGLTTNALIEEEVHNLSTRPIQEWDAHEQHPIATYGATADGFNATGMPPQRATR